MNNPDVSAVVISLNSRKFLRGCLDSLRAAEWDEFSYEIVVVDNGSTDGSQEMLRAEYPTVRLVENKENLGFSIAANQGARASAGRYFLLLNDDIIIHPDAIPRLVRFMDQHPDAGMTGSRLLNTDGTDQFSSGRTFPTPMNALFGRKSALTRLFPNAPWARGYLLSHRISENEPYEVDWLSAAALLARRQLYLDLGGLPEDFYYFVEILYCDIMKKAGYKIYLDPKSLITHFEGAGSGVRTRRVRRRHIIRFHVGAFRWYCLHRGFGAWNPLRYLVGAVLGLRAGLLVVADTLRIVREKQHPALAGGGPEGGVRI